ncbi:hypothetical protein SAMN05443248_5125 [Bradyrhizobium erythrophlei]|uniref:Uncharacterized protein n=1 Tax=Bradyrhizobium erythrophlei TaxID=1437360 RepID=A0A1M5TRJ7_9BRAD|nr:hypothetical protein SAMN05443248_5125 [Bradyrhizobium erythrophlei]
MQSLFLRSVAIVQFYMWYSGEITKSNAVVRCWYETDQTGRSDDVRCSGYSGLSANGSPHPSLMTQPGPCVCVALPR